MGTHAVEHRPGVVATMMCDHKKQGDPSIQKKKAAIVRSRHRVSGAVQDAGADTTDQGGISSGRRASMPELHGGNEVSPKQRRKGFISLSERLASFQSWSEPSSHGANRAPVDSAPCTKQSDAMQREANNTSMKTISAATTCSGSSLAMDCNTSKVLAGKLLDSDGRREAEVGAVKRVATLLLLLVCLMALLFQFMHLLEGFGLEVACQAGPLVHHHLCTYWAEIENDTKMPSLPTAGKPSLAAF